MARYTDATRTVQLVEGPLDGMTFSAQPPGESGDGAYMIVSGEMFRAIYEPDEDGQDRWKFRGWIG
jgi:hypothetical protein